jgi:hypothetical protein
MQKQSQTVWTSLNDCDCASQVSLWTLRFDFDVVFTGHKILFFFPTIITLPTMQTEIPQVIAFKMLLEYIPNKVGFFQP